MLDLSAQGDIAGLSGDVLITAALGLVEVVRDPDGKEQGIGSAPAEMIDAIVLQHPFFIKAART